MGLFDPAQREGGRVRTFFADETVIAIVGVIRVAQSSMRVFELQKLMAVLARVSCAAAEISNTL